MRKPGTDDIWEPDPAKGWITNKAGYENLLSKNKIWWPPSSKTGWPRKKRYLTETQERMPASSFWSDFRTQSGAKELDEILGERVFAFPKPISLMQRIISYCAPPGSLVLDSFAGSGTTGHAVLKQNAEDGGHRRFILVEMDENIARNVTAERVRRVCTGYTKGALTPARSPEEGEKTQVAGLGGGFQFCRLSAEPLFTADGQIRPDVSFAQLAEFVWFAETGAGYTGRADSPLLGIHEGRAIYLLYNGILKDYSAAGGNVLTGAVLALLPPFDGPKVIYAAATRLGARAAREGITFKQTPYALEV